MVAGEVAVEAGERAAAACQDRLDAAGERGVGARELVLVDRAAVARMVEQRTEAMLLLGGWELHAREPGRERRHRRIPVGVQLPEIFRQAHDLFCTESTAVDALGQEP